MDEDFIPPGALTGGPALDPVALAEDFIPDQVRLQSSPVGSGPSPLSSPEAWGSWLLLA
jgi:hypothetical protein